MTTRQNLNALVDAINAVELKLEEIVLIVDVANRRMSDGEFFLHMRENGIVEVRKDF